MCSSKYQNSCMEPASGLMAALAVRARRLEDRIRELCAQAVTAQQPELGTFLSTLQLALREHNSRLRKLAATKLATGWPTGARIVAVPIFRAPVECSICGSRISLEDSKVNEDGQPVHEECYVSKLTSSNVKQELPRDSSESTSSNRTKPGDSMQLLAS